MKTTEDAMIEAMESLRDARHLLNILTTTMMGTGYDPNPNSQVAKVMKKAEDTEKMLRQVLVAQMNAS